MKFVLDTSAYSAFNRGDVRLRQWFQPDSEIVFPLIVVGELRAGFALGHKFKENVGLLERFMDSPSVSCMTISDSTTVQYASIYRELRQKGKPIGTNDMWIAALAREQQVPLLTLDANFKNVIGLELLGV